MWEILGTAGYLLGGFIAVAVIFAIVVQVFNALFDSPIFQAFFSILMILIIVLIFISLLDNFFQWNLFNTIFDFFR